VGYSFDDESNNAFEISEDLSQELIHDGTFTVFAGARAGYEVYTLLGLVHADGT
jgi:hypothetical protein